MFKKLNAPLQVWWVDSRGRGWGGSLLGHCADGVGGRLEAMQRMSWDNEQGSHGAGRRQVWLLSAVMSKREKDRNQK